LKRKSQSILYVKLTGLHNRTKREMLYASKESRRNPQKKVGRILFKAFWVEN